MRTSTGVRTGIILGAIMLGSATSASAQTSLRPAVSVVASTLGLGGEVSLRSRFVGARVGYYLAGPDFDRDVKGIRYTVEPHFRNGRAVLDLHPFGNAFRLSGGLVLNRARAHGSAVLTEPVTIGNRTYQPSEVGEVLGEAHYPREIMPFLGLGTASGGRIGFLFDLGVGFSGRPKVRLQGQTNLTGAERLEFEQNVALEEADIQQSISDQPLAKYYPILALGITVRF